MPGSRLQSQADPVGEGTKQRTEAEDEAHSPPEGPGPSHLTKSPLLVLCKRAADPTYSLLYRVPRTVLQAHRRDNYAEERVSSEIVRMFDKARCCKCQEIAGDEGKH